MSTNHRFFPSSLFIAIYLIIIWGVVFAEDEIFNSQNNPLVSLYGFPETNINGVNVINGDYNYSTVDFHLPGSNPLILQRSYSTSSMQRRALFDGWTHNLCSTINILDDARKLHIKAISYGSLSGEIPYTAKRFRSRNNQNHTCKIDNKILEKGVTNSGRGEISGRTNLKNNNINLRKRLPKYLSQTNGDGSVHIHQRQEIYEDNEPVCYRLIKTQMPTGCSVRYETSDFILRKVSHHDLQGNLTQMLTATIFDDETIKTRETDKRRFHFDIFSQDGRKVTYHFQSYKKHGDKKNRRITCLEKIQSTHSPDEHYYYTEQTKKIQKKLKERRGNSHRIQINYFNKNDIAYKNENSNAIISRKHIAFERVKEINVAVSDLNNLEQLCRFTYTENKKAKEAFTDVYDDQNRLTRFIYSTKDYRLRTIDYFEGSDVYNIVRRDKMFWGKSGSLNDSNLITRSIGDVRGKIHFTENYQYDPKGNPIRKECRFLRATSLTENPILLQNAQVSGGEVTFVETEYNDSNLPIQVYDGRIHTELSYTPSPPELIASRKKQTFSTTPLVKRRLKRDDHTILKREFYDYDHTTGATSYTIDDGSGVELDDLTNVQQRLVNRCLNKCGIFAGLPLIMTSSGWDSQLQTERLIQKTEYEYDKHGHITSEDHYDSDNLLAYTINKTHDIQGNTLSETNSLGQVTTRTFNKYRCLLKEQGPSPTFYTEFHYDLLQRPISTTYVYADGLKLSTHTSYNLQGKPTQEIGIYGQTTTKHYNNQYRLQTLTEPPIRTGSGEWRSPQTHYTYDFMGNIATETDSSGAQTIYQCSTLGKPLSIQHPDGRIEYFKYSIFGDLIEKIDPNGTKITYTYDSLGRTLSENTYNIQGDQLKSHRFTYAGVNLVKEEEGDLTITYAYDYAGRLIRKCVGTNCIEYFYDSLGRQIEERTYYGYDLNDYISTKKIYDLLNRVVEEQSTDASGKSYRHITQTYDELGNVASVSVTTHAGIATTTKKYDLRGNLCAETDALGNTTHYIHKYDYFFEGQNVPYVETIDPLGVKKTTISDYQGRVINEKIYSPFGEQLSETDFIYDISGNLAQKEYRLSSETIITLYSYDICHRLVCQINGAGTPEQLSTKFVYNVFGELTKTIYSDNSSKYHFYDALGRLYEERSDDGSIHYRYTYNQNDIPIIIENLTTSTKTIRKYSPEGNLLLEQFENGLKVEYNYDRMNRVTELHYPENNSIRKIYNPVVLEKTERFKNGKLAYSAHFEGGDLSNGPKKIQFPKKSGALFLEYDLLNRPTSLTSVFYREEQICYDTRGQLASKIVNNDLHQFEHDFLCQLTLEKSSQYSHTYENDALNRQTTVDGISQIHNAVHQLIHGIHNGYTYDLKGRRIKDGIIQYAYDKFDRIQRINCNDEIWSYTYDAFNRKISRSKNGKYSYYIYIGQEEVGSYDEEGNNLDFKVLSGNEGSLPIAIELKEKPYTPLISSQGHIIGLVDIDDGSLFEEHFLTMFGCDLNKNPYSPWRFCGKRHESMNLGIIDFGHRYYHAKSAQWMTRDPIGESEGPNLYAYVHNNPTRCIDRYGLFALSWGFNSSDDSSGDFSSILKAICHGTFDFAAETVWDLEQGFFHLGNTLSEFDYNERNELTSHFNQMESEQRASVEASVKNLLDVDESDENYDLIRHYTTTGLEIGSLLYAGCKGIQGGYKLYKHFKSLTALEFLTRCKTTPANGTSPINNLQKTSKYTYTKTVENHITDIVKRGSYKGELSRPYLTSELTITEIINASEPILDPGGIPGAFRWDSPGKFRGRDGTWELVLHPQTGIIYHFNFR